MADHKNKNGRPERDRINISEDHEVHYWSEKLGVSRQQLIDIVKKVGPMVKDVEKALKK